jgi:hypothetical protein
MKISRKAIKESLEKQGIESTLLVRKGTLTTKQRKFAEGVAMGSTKAQAYRDAYNQNPAPSTIVTTPYALAKDPRIVREIEAYSLAIEAAKYRTSEDLTDIVGIDNSLLDELNSNVGKGDDLSLEELVESGKTELIEGFEEGTVPQPPRIEESEVVSMEHIITLKQSDSLSNSHKQSNSQNTPPYEK